MDLNATLFQALFFALAGWIATCDRIVHSRISLKVRRLLVIPLWFAWMGLAMGGLLVQGAITPMDALTVSISFSFGMFLFMLSRRKQQQRPE